MVTRRLALGITVACMPAIPALAQAPVGTATPPHTIITRGEALVASQQAYRKNDREVSTAVAKIVRQAEQQLTAPHVAVTDKRTQLPPSGNKNDYYSLSPYWWPDSTKADGLPYIRRDGVTNPESKEDLDQPRVSGLAERVQVLTLAWWFTGDRQYADMAVGQLRAWFITPATRMTPHLRFAQHVRGNNAERGSGIIDSRSFIEVVDAIGMLETSPAWTPAVDSAVRNWFREYLTWLTESPNGITEHAAKNNHGSWYAAQVAAYALFVGDSATAKRLANETMNRIAWQFEPNGKQPEEFARTRSFHYSNFNLEALSRVAEIGRLVGVDVWGYTSPDGASLQKGIEFMAPYVDKQKDWPGDQLDPVNRGDLFRTFRRAAIATNAPVLRSTAKQLASGTQLQDRWIVLFYSPAR